MFGRKIHYDGVWFCTPTIKNLLYLDTLNIHNDFELYLSTFLGNIDFKPNIFKYSHYIYLMGVCMDTGELMENIDSNDPFEKKKREKLMKGQATNSNNTIMDTITALCLGDSSQSFSDIINMNLIEVRGFSDSQDKLLSNIKNKSKNKPVSIDEMNIKKM